MLGSVFPYFPNPGSCTLASLSPHPQPPPLFSHLQRFPVVTICLQMFAPSFVPWRCLAKTIHDNYRGSSPLTNQSLKEPFSLKPVVTSPQGLFCFAKTKPRGLFQSCFFSSLTKNVSFLSQCSDREAWHTDCYLQSSLQ